MCEDGRFVDFAVVFLSGINQVFDGNDGCIEYL